MSDFETKIVVTRGTGSNDKEKMTTTTVTAPSIEELSKRVDEVREEMEGWAEDFRAIDPERGRPLSDDQSRLGGEA